MSEQADIIFTDQQQQLLEIAEIFSGNKSPMDSVRRQLEAESSIAPELWREIADLGWLGIAIPEEYGGSGLGLGEVAAIVEPMGRNLFSSPLISTTLAAQAILRGGGEQQKSQWLPRLAAGTIAALALTEAHGDWDLTNLTCSATRDGDRLHLSGGKTFVTDAEMADLFLISVELAGEPHVVLVEPSDFGADAMRREIVIDESRRSHALSLDGVSIHLDNLLPSANLHRLHLGLEQARSHLYHAATVFDMNEGRGEVAVRMAKAQTADAFAFASDRAIQFHGAFGFTYECDAQLYRRRALWCEQQHGDGAHHRKHLAELLLD